MTCNANDACAGEFGRNRRGTATSKDSEIGVFVIASAKPPSADTATVFADQKTVAFDFKVADSTLEVKSEPAETKEFDPSNSDTTSAEFAADLDVQFKTEPLCKDDVCCNPTICDNIFGLSSACCTSESICRNDASCIMPWEYRDGCCREVTGGQTYNHHDTALVQEKSFKSIVDATADCTQKCENDQKCTAFEMIAKKKKKKKKSKRKSFSTCELHYSTINSASRSTKSCKKAKCTIKLVQAKVKPATQSAPEPPTTACPLAVWENSLKGCCRERDGKKDLAHQDSTTSVTLAEKSFTAAVEACKAACDAVADCGCSAAETRRIKKKKVVTFVCELHSATGLNSASQKSKSCKKAACFIKSNQYDRI